MSSGSGSDCEVSKLRIIIILLVLIFKMKSFYSPLIPLNQRKLRVGVECVCNIYEAGYASDH